MFVYNCNIFSREMLVEIVLRFYFLLFRIFIIKEGFNDIYVTIK